MVANVNRIVVSTAAGLSAVLVAFAGGYGYHRDELYFVAAGRRLDWAYADQGPFTPLVARAMSEIAPDSLTVLRIPSALAAGATVLLTGLLACELGGGPRAQVIAAACTAVAGLVLFTMRSCRVAARIDNGVGVDNDEQRAGAGLPRTGPADPGQPGGDRPPRARRLRGRARADDAGGPGAAGPAIV